MAKINSFSRTIDEWYNKISSGEFCPFPLEQLRMVKISGETSIIDDDSLELESLHAEITPNQVLNNCIIFHGEGVWDADKKQQINLLLTVLFKSPLNPSEEELNSFILGAFYSFGINIGEKAIVIKYIEDLIESTNYGPIDFTRNVNIMKKIGLKLKHAPYIIFSKKPLDSYPNRKEIYPISLNIKNPKILNDLLNDLQMKGLTESDPGIIQKLKSWVGKDHIYIKIILKGLKELLEYLNNFKDLMKTYSE